MPLDVASPVGATLPRTAAVMTAATAPALALSEVSVRFGPVPAVDRVSLVLAPGELLALVGPSGSGKSTLLRAIAGIERLSSGRIEIAGRDVAGPRTFVEPEHRRVGMVFQDYALFPHLTVAANVAFGLTGPKPARADRARALLDLVGLARYASSYPHVLSGGERQRVALARALAPEPSVLLLDEPFSSLDGELREQVREETVALLRRLGTTTVIVTHDADEAVRIADRIALLQQGRLLQCGDAQTLYMRPATIGAVRLFGDVNLLPGVCRHGWVQTPLGRFAANGVSEGARVSVCVRPHHLHLAAGGAGVAARAAHVSFTGDDAIVGVAVDGLPRPLRLRVPAASAPSTGDVLRIDVRPVDVFVIAH
jgi:iron(III) transport system ATP-binding protein